MGTRSTAICRNSDSYRSSNMSDKSCQVTNYLVPSISITSLRNLAFIPNRHLDFCKNNREIGHWSMLLERRGLRTGVFYQCGNN